MKALFLSLTILFSTFLAQAQNSNLIVTISQACIGAPIDLSYSATQSPINGYDVFTGSGTILGNPNTAVTLYFTGSHWVMDFGAGGIYYYNTSTSSTPPTSGWMPVDVDGNGNALDDCEGSNPLVVTQTLSLNLDQMPWSIRRMDDGHVQLNYEPDNVDVSKIHIQRSTDLLEWETLQIGLTKTGALLDTTAGPQKLYYRMAKEYTDGFHYSQIRFVAEMNIDPGALYPNPAGERINLRHAERYTAWGVYTALGQLLLKGSNIDTHIDISTLDPGMYLLRVYAENGRYETLRFQKK